jgi:hypothetical protein
MPGYKNPMNMMGMRDENLMKRKMMMTAKIGKELKQVPSGKDGAGLRALPASVRNKMGYARRGKEMKYQGGGAPGDGKDKKPKTMMQYYAGGTPAVNKRGKRIPGMFEGNM